jgi:hypothetical protein
MGNSIDSTKIVKMQDGAVRMREPSMGTSHMLQASITEVEVTLRLTVSQY